MDYDPNLTTSGFMATQRVRLTFGMWQYRHTVEVDVGGNCTGLTVIDSAVEAAYDDLPYIESIDAARVAKIVLTDQEGDSLSVEDDDLKADDWLKDMLVAAEIVSITPEDRGHG
ncbi:DUF5406 family protein [Ectothiorhodospiraceae bacterium WFHF3C12]|nr:DUF5406 family protein [Ectothiorhodospiraceae bacterium WFHF3C12]